MQLRHWCWFGMVWLVWGGETVAQTAANRPRAAVWLADVPGGDAVLVKEMAESVQTAGYDTTFLDSSALTNVAQLDAARFDLLVLPGARAMPADASVALEAFLKAGGDMLALGLPAWQTPLFRLKDRWVSRLEYDRRLGAQKPERGLIDFAREDLGRWTRHSNQPQSRGTRERVNDAGGAALHVVIEDLNGWDTFASPPFPAAFAPGHTLTCFRARGGPRTRQLALEFAEQDGSRWIATVNLTPQWQSYGLAPEAFRPWQPPAGRGGAGDRLNVRKVSGFTVGLALTHTAIEPGPHEYWVADLGTASNPFGEAAPPMNPRLPRLESFSPEYQCYPITTPVRVRPLGWVRDGLADAITWGKPLAGAVGLHPRPQGAGLTQDRPWRWQPLLGAYDSQTDEYRGALATLIVHVKPPYRGSLWALATPAEPQFYRQAEIQAWLGRTLRQMRQGVFLQEGGSEFFTVFEDQSVRLGARVVNFGHAVATKLQVSLEVTSRSGTVPLFAYQWTNSAAPGQTVAVETDWKPVTWPAAGCRVAVTLSGGQGIADELHHELNQWRPRAKPRFIAARQGGLWLEDKPWKAHGVNYMPSSGIGVGSEYFEYWLDRGAYDPAVIQRDLERIRGMGLNAVSVFIYYRSLPAQHLLDFLFRCDGLGLKVSQSLRPGTPMDFRWNEMKALIEHYRLAQNDTVFAYDLAWEPSHFDHQHQQQQYAQLWQEWVRQRRGSLEKAEAAWGFPAPEEAVRSKPQPATRPPESLAVPSMRHLTQDGPWRKLAADYRWFLDDLLREKYGAARRLVRTVDPRHAVSFRMQYAGDPTLNWEQMLPYDLPGLVAAVDLWEPEGYGRIGDWDRVKAGHFTAAYARLCDASKPLIWAEMGYNTWDLNLMAPQPEKLEFAARFYRDFYRMLRESGADGVFSWWYPGGFRLYENSDYGIINPDGTDRPVTGVIRTEGPRFLAAPKPPAPDYWITVDRDLDARGLFGIYETVKDEYWRAVEAGKTVGLRWPVGK